MKNNPFIGPRPFERRHRDQFYGREREARELQSLIISEREVVFYAQSGAGKSSLLNARVIPNLEDEGYTIFPVIRVGSELPPGIESHAVANIFIFSTLLSLAGSEADPQTLVKMTLVDWLKDACEVELPILIFDQFEEIFTTYRERWQDADDFFRQVRQALDTYSNLGVVFAMREDYLAAVDSYTQFFARRLRARFRMELLGTTGALSAVRQPAQAAGYRFEPGAAERLVDNLRQIKAQNLAQAGETVVLGPYVEPVQLQVVCSQLWDNLPEQEPNDHMIEWAEIEKFGDIDHALTGFYENAIAAATANGKEGAKSLVNERTVRLWFGEKMVTPMETRGLVMRGPEETAGMPNAAVNALEAQHIIRADMRAGARWYELSHDRLISPILASNKAWDQQQEQLHLWRPIARRWRETGSESLLYRGEELEKAHLWLNTASPDEIVPDEKEFILASLAAEKARQQAQRRRKVQNIIYALAGTALIIVVIYLWYATNQATAARESAVKSELNAKASAATAVAEAEKSAALQAIAEEAKKEAEAEKKRAEEAAVKSEEASQEAIAQRKNAQVRGLVALAQNYSDHDNPKMATLLDIEALKMQPDAANNQALRSHLGLLAPPISPDSKILTQGEIASSVFSADNKWVLSFGCSQYNGGAASLACTRSFIILWEAATGKEILNQSVEGWVKGALLRQDGQWVMGWGCKQFYSTNNPVICTSGFVTVWEVSNGRILMDKQQNGLVSTAAFNPNNQYVITGGCDETSVRANKAICVMGFSKVWNVPAASEIADKSLDGMVNVSLFDHTGKKVLMGGCYNYNLKAEIPYCESSSLMVWDIDSGKVSGKLPKPGEIRQAAFNHDSSFVLTVFCHHYNDGSTNRVCVDSSTVIWSATSNWEKATIQQKGEINNAFFSPNSLRVISSGCDQYDFISGDPVCTIYKAHVLSWINGSEIQNFATNEAARAIEFSPDNKNVLTIKDKEIVVWEADSGNVVASIKSPVQKIYQAAFSPDGKRVIANSCDQVDASSGVCTAGSARLWDIATQKEIARMMQDGPVQSAAFNSDGSWLVSGGCDNLVLYGSRHVCSAGSAHVWKPGNPGEIAHFTQGGKVSYVAFSPDGKRVISKGCDQPACNTQSIIIWDALSGKATIIVGAGKINATSFSPDGKSVVSMGCSVFSTYLCTTSVINIWDAESGKKIIGPIDIQGQAADVQFSPDGKYLIQNSCRLYQNNHPDQNCILALVTAYDTVTGKITFTQEYDGQIFSLAFAPDGQKFSLAQCEAYSDDAKSVCTSGVVRVVDITSKKEDMKINLNGAVYSASFSSDGATLVTSGCSRFSADTGDCIFGFVHVMDAGTGKDTLEPMEYAGDVHQAIFSPDGQQVVSISRDGPFIVWDAATGKETFRSKSTKNILSVAYSQDGERIVTGSSDHTASVWDSATGVELARVTHDEGVNHVEFSPDGKWIVSGGDDGTVRVWPWATDELISLACERIPRNMTQKEWDEVIPGEDYRLTCPNLPKPAN